MCQLLKITRNVCIWIITVYPMLSGTGSEVVHSAAKEEPKPLTVVQAIKLAAFNEGLDANLMLAIAKVESNLDPEARGALDDTGLFQLRKRFHGEGASTDAYTNSVTAARYLKWLKKRPKCAEYGAAWYVCFNTGPNSIPLDNPTTFSYYKKVQQALLSVEEASQTADNADL